MERRDGLTCLCGCVCAGNAEQLQQLLDDPECNVDLQDEEGRTALHFAGEAATVTS
jgi:ankyrin repeat protein